MNREGSFNINTRIVIYTNNGLNIELSEITCKQILLDGCHTEKGSIMLG